MIDLSPNRQLVAIQVGWINQDILVWDLVRGAPVGRLQRDWSQEWMTWMPDSERLLFRDVIAGESRYYLWDVNRNQTRAVFDRSRRVSRRAAAERLS